MSRLGILGAARCVPCSQGNHTGSNGTRGCEGSGCACTCRRAISDRPEHESCERSTPGCSIDHTRDAGGCETW